MNDAISRDTLLLGTVEKWTHNDSKMDCFEVSCHPEEVCRDPQGFLLDGQLLLPYPHSGGPNLGDINYRLWNGHRRRVEDAIARLQNGKL